MPSRYRYQFPQGMDALSICQIKASLPTDHASQYNKYNGWYSRILQAVVDHRYRFLYTNVGSPGRNHDDATFCRSHLPSVLASDLFSREAKILQGVHVGPVLLADQAFPLKPSIMTPYPPWQGWVFFKGLQLSPVKC